MTNRATQNSIALLLKQLRTIVVDKHPLDVKSREREKGGSVKFSH